MFQNNVQQCCVSGMFFPDPDLYPPGSQIPDLGSKNSNKREGGKHLLSYLFCCHKYHKIETYSIFELVKKNFWTNLQRIIESRIRDPGSGKNLFRMPGSKRHRIRIQIRNNDVKSKVSVSPSVNYGGHDN